MDDIRSSQMKDYANNSFDRFGDDLTQEVLQYLTFEDKVRLECVSKQWRRLVFNKQFVIEVYNKESKYYFFDLQKKNNNSLEMLYRRIDNKRQLNEQTVESVLKKCPNIKRVIILGEVSSEVLSLFGQYCPRIRSLRLAINGIECMPFFLNYGHKLEELIIHKINNYCKTVNIREVLDLSPNLKKVELKNVPKGLHYLIGDKDFLPKLEFLSIDDLPKDVNHLKILSDKYSLAIKTLELHFGDMSYEELKTCIGYICRFENLRELRLEVNSGGMTKPLEDCLSLIGQKCNKLLKLDLTVERRVPISDRFFDVFIQFKTLKKLRINLLYSTRVLSGSVECFKHCKQLTELEINYEELREDFFANIATFVPKLQLLNIYTNKQYSDSFIDSFLAMKDIQRIELKDINIDYPKIWNFRKCLNEIMLSRDRKEVIQVNDICGRFDYNYVESVHYYDYDYGDY